MQATRQTTDNNEQAGAAKSLQSCPTLRPHRRQPTRPHHPWDSPGKNTGAHIPYPLCCKYIMIINRSSAYKSLSDPRLPLRGRGYGRSANCGSWFRQELGGRSPCYPHQQRSARNGRGNLLSRAFPCRKSRYPSSIILYNPNRRDDIIRVSTNIRPFQSLYDQ